MSRARTLVRILTLSTAAVFVAGTEGSVFAQGAQGNLPARQTNGLFANPAPATTSGQTLNIGATLVEAYDDDVTSEGGAPTNLLTDPLSGFYSMVTADADYAWHGRRVQVGLSGLAAVRYYSALDTVRSASSSAGAGVAVNFSPRTSWSFNQTVAYSPSYFYGLFPSVGSAPEPGDLPNTADPNYTLNTRSSYFYGLSTTVNHRFSRNGAIAFSADGSYTDFQQPTPDVRDLRAGVARIQYSRNVSKNGSLRVGYHYRHGDSGVVGVGMTSEHGIEFGLDTVRPLSATRKALFSFTVGPSAIDTPSILIGNAASGETATLYRLSADVMAGYQFRRTWQARGTYRRGLEYVPALSTPVFTGATSASLEGLFSPRIDFRLSGGYSNGKSVLANASSFNTYNGEVRLRYALSRHWAAFAEYLYYYYDFRGAPQLLLLPGMSPGFERNGVRVGISLRVSPLGR